MQEIEITLYILKFPRSNSDVVGIIFKSVSSRLLIQLCILYGFYDLSFQMLSMKQTQQKF